MKNHRLFAVLIGLAASTGAIALAAAPATAPATQPTTKPYAMTTCLVSGEKLGGDMGEPVVYKHEGREVHLCCSMCIATFKKDPAKYLKILDEAEAKEPATKPSK